MFSSVGELIKTLNEMNIAWILLKAKSKIKVDYYKGTNFKIFDFLSFAKIR